jgi:uncharacterized protein YjeT (DUF2065 family)
MWHELLIAFALMLVLEGILPFLSPGTMRSILRVASESDDHSLRIGGLVSMVLGVLMLYLVN